MWMDIFHAFGAPRPLEQAFFGDFTQWRVKLSLLSFPCNKSPDRCPGLTG